MSADRTPDFSGATLCSASFAAPFNASDQAVPFSLWKRNTQLDEISLPLESVGIHVVIDRDLPDGNSVLELDQLEDELIQGVQSSRAGVFDGNLFGGAEAVFSFQPRSPAALLSQARKILARHGLLQKAYATVGDGVTSESQTIALESPITPTTVRPRKRTRRSRIGDYFAIPLPDGRWRYAFYITKLPGIGDFVLVLDLVTNEVVESVDALVAARPAFPPVSTWVEGCAKALNWKYLGNRKPETVPLIVQRSSVTAAESRKPGVYHDWHISRRSADSADSIEFVGDLTDEQRHLEFFQVWLPAELRERIVSGINLYAMLL